MTHTTRIKQIFALGLLLTSTSILQATQKEAYTIPNGYYHIILTNTEYTNHLLSFHNEEKDNLSIYIHTVGKTEMPKNRHVSFYLEREKNKHNTKDPTYTLRLDKENTNSYALFYTQENKLVLSQKNRSSFLLQEMNRKHNNLANLNPLLYQNKKNTYLLKLIDKKSKKEILGNGFVPQSIKNNSLVTTIQSPCILSLADYNQLPQKINLPSVQHHRQLSSTNQQQKKLTIEDMVKNVKYTEIKNGYYYALIYAQDNKSTHAIVRDLNKENVIVLEQENKEYSDDLQRPDGNRVFFEFIEEEQNSGIGTLSAHGDIDDFLTKNIDGTFCFSEQKEEDDNDKTIQFFYFKEIKKDYKQYTGFTNQKCLKEKKFTPVVMYDFQNNPIKIEDLFIEEEVVKKEETTAKVKVQQTLNKKREEIQNNDNTQNNTSTTSVISLLTSFSLLLFDPNSETKPSTVNLCNAPSKSPVRD